LGRRPDQAALLECRDEPDDGGLGQSGGLDDVTDRDGRTILSEQRQDVQRSLDAPHTLLIRRVTGGFAAVNGLTRGCRLHGQPLSSGREVRRWAPIDLYIGSDSPARRGFRAFVTFRRRPIARTCERAVRYTQSAQRSSRSIQWST